MLGWNSGISQVLKLDFKTSFGIKNSLIKLLFKLKLYEKN